MEKRQTRRNKEEIERQAQSNQEYREMPRVYIEADTTPKKQRGLRVILVLLVLLGIGIFAGSCLLFKDSQEKPYVPIEEEPVKEEVSKDTSSPEFIGFLDRIVVNLNAANVDLRMYYLALDENGQADVLVKGDVDYTIEGEYPITVIAQDAHGNETAKEAIVQIVSDDTMAATAVEWSSMIDGSIPLSLETKQKIDANVLLFYYKEVSADIQEKQKELGIEVINNRVDPIWHP